jgi:hypothetical protein
VCRLKVKRRYGRYFERLIDHECIGVFNVPEAMALGRYCKKIDGDLRMAPISHNIFCLFSVGRRPVKLDEWGDWQVFEV